MTTPPEDEHLGPRLRSEAFVRAGEARIARTWFEALTRWLDRLRPQVLRDDRVNASAVSNETAFWGRLMVETVVPEIASLLVRVASRITQSRESVTDPWTADYLNAVGNRLVRTPDEVYAMVVTQIETGTREGESIPDITARVRQVLTASGTDFWPHRAVTVARTETIGSVNAGAYRGAVLLSERQGDTDPEKVWLATMDARTRPAHWDADRQRVPLNSQFLVGGANLLFPGDPTGPPNQVINCRCSNLHVVAGEILDWTDRQDP